MAFGSLEKGDTVKVIVGTSPLIPLTSRTRIFLATGATDMRTSFDGLCALVEDVIRAEPMSGHLFLFRSRHGDRLKILWYDRSGYCIWYKRLQKGTFRLPPCNAERVEIDARDLMMILEGLDHRDVKKRPVYEGARDS